MNSKESDKTWIVLGIVIIIACIFALCFSQHQVDNSRSLENQFKREYTQFERNGNNLRDFKRAFKTAKELDIKYSNSDALDKLDKTHVRKHDRTYNVEITERYKTPEKDTYYLN